MIGDTLGLAVSGETDGAAVTGDVVGPEVGKWATLYRYSVEPRSICITLLVLSHSMACGVSRRTLVPSPSSEAPPPMIVDTIPPLMSTSRIKSFPESAT